MMALPPSPATSPTRTPRSAPSPPRWSASAASTRWSTTPGSSSASRCCSARARSSTGSCAINTAGFFEQTRHAVPAMLAHGDGGGVRQHLDRAGRAARGPPPRGARGADQGRDRGGDTLAGHRAGAAAHPRQRGRARRRPDAAERRDRRGRDRGRAPARPDRRGSSRTGAVLFCTWSPRRSSPASCCRRRRPDRRPLAPPKAYTLVSAASSCGTTLSKA